MVEYSIGGLRDMFLGNVRRLKEILKYAKISSDVAEIDASNLVHKEVNDLMRYCALQGVRRIVLKGVRGQRYIGTRLYFPDPRPKLEIEIHGFPGNDLGAFLDGHRIVVYGNAQDGVGNTMDSGEIVIYGQAGDVVAMSMRGGRIFIRDDVGYRTAIHMKEYRDKVPVLVVGGTAQDFFGEYMAGGRVVLLGLNLDDKPHRARYIDTGMHGGIMYIRGRVEPWQLGKEVGIVDMEAEDWKFIEKHVGDFCEIFGIKEDEVLGGSFLKLKPVTKRPYGKVYAY
ncbi:MAG: Glutamate synthase domain 3 [Candidatus Alkanophagales archaeon MCA70_species_1]|nr:Glutamate synthase domain 3 [Candidatus Alkanophaga volatiphilum]